MVEFCRGGAASPLYLSTRLGAEGAPRCWSVLNRFCRRTGGCIFRWKLGCGRGQVASPSASCSSSAERVLWSGGSPPRGPAGGPGEGGRRRHLCSAGVSLALSGPGEEGDRPPGGEGAEGAEQEDPGGQPAGAAEGGAPRATLLPSGGLPGWLTLAYVKGDLIGLRGESRGHWLQTRLDPGARAVTPESCFPPPRLCWPLGFILRRSLLGGQSGPGC